MANKILRHYEVKIIAPIYVYAKDENEARKEAQSYASDFLDLANVSTGEVKEITHG